MQERLEQLNQRHRRLNRLIDNCRAASRQEEMKTLKRIRLRLKDEIAQLRRRVAVTG
tara:strand:+ start:94 stop:264 length:171 start_codon:yes stop_codon:yes gene_type:complete